MQIKAAVGEVISRSGLSKIKISQLMGKTDNYVYSLLNKRTNPSSGTLTTIGDICGYELVFRKRGSTNESDVIVLDPPEN